MPEDLLVDPGLIMLMKTGGKVRLQPAKLEQMICDGASWLRYLHHVMGGPPARMLVNMGNKEEQIFVVRPSKLVNGTNYDDLDRQYPET